ncbi:WD40 repeat-like protein [Choiromyces venosus 120613-1]|uniref:WD40 repeat-like protein n=1 Tax=Choiromyces venosus 120613-1 TaxID=1336337 RepID=A0A3N4JVT7_9PEZI|nr:WD40 repeat-like protein [Choiromyces venosus 120613-1]
MSHSRSISQSSKSSKISPDRFIPSRANIQSFRMSAPAHLLSNEERLLRRSVSSSAERSISPNSLSNSPNGRNAAGLPINYRPGNLNRRISAGAVGVFGIGVGAAPRREEPRPRGREVTINVFGDKTSPEVDMERHERRLSAALGVDRSAKVLSFARENEPTRDGHGRKGGVMGVPGSETVSDMLWEDVLEAEGRDLTPQVSPSRRCPRRVVPTTPFRVLDAPGLRDDYYCSLIAYSPATHSLVVGLHTDIYSWTETGGARPFEAWSNSHVTALAFSCLQGKHNILAIGRIDGSLSLWNPVEPTPRLERAHDAGIACLAWKPVVSYRPDFGLQSNSGFSFSDRRSQSSSIMVETEELLVGDEFGNVYYYSIEWGKFREGLPAPASHASIVLLRRILVHSQQICGLAWSGDGEQFATGGNDNVACLFDTADVIRNRSGGVRSHEAIPLEGREKHRWTHGAAVKAIAFCPWQKSLLATGGGSNDRCIHFFHTFSGATLATINVSAQVTSLLWSNSHREIAATLGYANPEHPIRIAVFSWPECKQVVQVPWQEDMRALYAVAYPGGPNDDSAPSSSAVPSEDAENILEDVSTAGGSILTGGGGWRRREARESRERNKHANRVEGCIVVAASDETVRFHEVWSETRRGVLGWRGVLGGSDILEGLEGIEKDGAETIR